MDRMEVLQPFNCKILQAAQIAGGSALKRAHTEYEIQVLWGEQAGPHQLITVCKRYSDFLKLNGQLAKVLRKGALPKLTKGLGNTARASCARANGCFCM